jgi:predicted lipid-binding transport protein (Tim44 family)
MADDNVSFGNKIKDIEKISIDDINLTGSLAEVTLQFETLILSYTKDDKGHILAGDDERPVLLNDIWTFVRDVKSSDPNWTLTKTRSV